MTRAPAPSLATLARFNPAQPGTRGMKLAATGLLVAMAVTFLIARGFEPDYPWLAWVKAFAEAGHKRAQPIVMTTVAMVAGMVPTALSFHGDGSWRAPMGVTVIGGLIFSTALTLLFVPAFFSLAIDAEKWIARKFGGLLESDSSPTIAEPLPAE